MSQEVAAGPSAPSTVESVAELTKNLIAGRPDINVSVSCTVEGDSTNVTVHREQERGSPNGPMIGSSTFAATGHGRTSTHTVGTLPVHEHTTTQRVQGSASGVIVLDTTIHTDLSINHTRRAVPCTTNRRSQPQR
jgi:hypothetical protein